MTRESVLPSAKAYQGVAQHHDLIPAQQSSRDFGGAHRRSRMRAVMPIGEELYGPRDRHL
jgi:hypothetical protein